MGERKEDIGRPLGREMDQGDEASW